jgi:hypothetical protein
MVGGGCRCGAVRYTVQVESLPPTYACHCLDCQSSSGSAFSQQAILTDGMLQIDGETRMYEVPRPGGRISRQYICERCLTRLYNTNTGRPGMIALRAGTLDDSDQLDVVAHIWTKRKQAWIAIPPGVPSWPEAAPAEALTAALSPQG